MDSNKISGLPDSCIVQTYHSYQQERAGGRMGSYYVTPCEHDDLSGADSGSNLQEDGRMRRLAERFSAIATVTQPVSAQKIEVKTRVQSALQAFLKHDIEFCRQFVQPANPDCDKSFTPRFIRFFPVVSGILIDALVAKGESATDSDFELAGDVLKDTEVKTVFFQLIRATFSGLDSSRKTTADHLLKAYRKYPDGCYDAIVDGIISHRKSLPELQVAMDRNRLTRGFPVCYFSMLFGSKDDYYLGIDAQNYDANTVHNLCQAFASLLEQSRRGDLEPVNLLILNQIHQRLTKDVKSWYGDPISPTYDFSASHVFDIPKEKFTPSGYQEMMLFVQSCDQKYRGMDKLSPDNHAIFHICGYHAPNHEKPGKVTVRAYCDEPDKGNVRKKNVLINVLVDHRKALHRTPTPEDVRLSTARLAKRLMLLHYFLDGNGRTIIYLINRELLRNGQPPSIILDADAIAAKSSAEFSQMIKEGQDLFIGIQRNQQPALSNPPSLCFHDQAKRRLHGYLQQVWR
ncbi:MULTISPECIES: hypothetical protein [unclassified Endozoicomonas]|uniref:hypothetical protein n=1 Tax=unclassified Endozoicomonas TaxID=2644528 RepID=UPI003BB55624